MTGHKYDPDKADRLTGGLRARLMPLAESLAAFASAAEETWADIGCGPGFFTLPLARTVKKVYALDISSKMLTKLRANLDAAGAENVAPLLSQESVLPLPSEIVDGALLVFVAHELDEPAPFFLEIARILKTDGRLFVVEFAKRRSSFGPPMKHRLDKSQVDAWATAAGLRPDRSWNWTRRLLGWPYLSFEGWEYRKI